MSQQRIHAPELPDDLEWFNTPVHIQLADLRGKVVLLDFWTYCCINCQHILADLHKLERKYGDRIAVIGIHSPKFPNERLKGNVQKAINRHHVKHPVANDPSFQMWKQYGIKAWPTIIFIDPEGYIVGAVRGEGQFKKLDHYVDKFLKEGEEKGILDEDPLSYEPRSEPTGSILRFPGKILAAGNSLYISDSGNNRVLEANQHGRVMRIFGSTSHGLVDGNVETASFNNPQGLVKLDDNLYVADTDNHAIRRIQLKHGEVDTMAGSGKLGLYEASEYDDPLAANLNSPLDIAYYNGDLYIAMAGQHQIWRLDMGDRTLQVFSGSGREDILDGPADEAAYAQPSALAVGGNALFVADAETSAIRVVRLPDGQASTLIGAGLFEFGDIDGYCKQARLQHPQGVCFDAAKNLVYICDTYNHKVKCLNLENKEVTSFDTGDELKEPGGISLQNGKLWIANTNAHAVGYLDLQLGEYHPLELVIPDNVFDTF